MSDLPTALSELDLLRIKYDSERAQRLAAEATNLTMALQGIQKAQAEHAFAREALSKEMAERYKLGGADSIELQTGNIKRAALSLVPEAQSA
jgi:hypothetical protein